MPSGPSRPGSQRLSGLCQAIHGPSSEGLRAPWRWSRPWCLGRDSEANGRSVAECARWSSCGLIIGRLLAPLNSSRTSGPSADVRRVRRRGDNSRRKVQNVRGGSSGDYTISSDTTLSCSCVGALDAGGTTELAQLSKFRAVFQYSNPNGNKYQYNRFCIHSCQPSRVCIDTRADWCFFEGRKVVSPALTRCSQDTPVIPSSSYASNPCIGSGSGVWSSFVDGCPF